MKMFQSKAIAHGADRGRGHERQPAHTCRRLRHAATVDPPGAGHRFLGHVGLTLTHNGCSALSGMAAPNGTPTGSLTTGPGLNNGQQRTSRQVGQKFDDSPDGFAFSTVNIRARSAEFNHHIEKLTLVAGAKLYLPTK